MDEIGYSFVQLEISRALVTVTVAIANKYASNQLEAPP